MTSYKRWEIKKYPIGGRFCTECTRFRLNDLVFHNINGGCFVGEWLCLNHFVEKHPEFKKSKQYKEIIADLL